MANLCICIAHTSNPAIKKKVTRHRDVSEGVTVMRRPSVFSSASEPSVAWMEHLLPSPTPDGLFLGKDGKEGQEEAGKDRQSSKGKDRGGIGRF